MQKDSYYTDKNESLIQSEQKNWVFNTKWTRKNWKNKLKAKRVLDHQTRYAKRFRL